MEIRMGGFNFGMLTIKAKLFLIAVASLACLAGVGVSGLVGVSQLGTALNELKDKSMPAVMLAMELRVRQMQSLKLSQEIEEFKPQAFDGKMEDGLIEINSLAKSVLDRMSDNDRHRAKIF